MQKVEDTGEADKNAQLSPSEDFSSGEEDEVFWNEEQDQSGHLSMASSADTPVVLQWSVTCNCFIAILLADSAAQVKVEYGVEGVGGGEVSTWESCVV